MNTRLSLLAVAVGLSGLSAQARALDAPAAPHQGLSELGDEELADMRGRYTTDQGKTVAFFGVRMISTWQTQAGQMLQSSLALKMDFDHGSGTPQISFEPTVNIMQAAQQVTGAVATTDTTHRTVDGSGLNNVNGLVQGVQVAGDSNVASNVTQLNVRDEDGSTTAAPSTGANGAIASATPAATTQTAPTTSGGTANAAGAGTGAPPAPAAAVATATRSASVTDGPATASASFDGSGAQVMLSIAGQGQVQQWIRNGSLGQTIQLTADAQSIQNSIQIDLLRRTVASNVQLSQNFAQSLNQLRGIGQY